MVVDNSDSTVIGANFGPGKPFWALGDADYNGAVDNDDITLLGVYYNANFDLDVHATSSNY